MMHCVSALHLICAYGGLDDGLDKLEEMNG